MDLNSSRIYRKLDAKWRIGGVELPDLLFVLIFAAAMNLFFGRTILVIPLVFIIPILLLIILYFGKKNKPNGFLVHLIRFYITAGFYSAGQDSKYLNNLKEKIYEE